MALFNKLFSSRKKNFNRTEDNNCNKAFTFNKEQARVVLFWECDFRGRKLLFDSSSVERVTLRTNDIQENGTTTNAEKFIEISNGYGYMYTKPQRDIGQMGEMVFGSVAMSFRGTSLKIHSLSNPSSLMCTQVFPSPQQNTRFSVPSKTCKQRKISTYSLDCSLRFDDSGASSTTSMSDQLSVYSSESETKLVCRDSSVPLDVPSTQKLPVNLSNNLSPSLIGDSGFGGDHSFSSFGSDSASIPMWELSLPNGSTHAFSCGSLYKRWLRSASTSLDCSNGISLQCSASADECLKRRHQKARKLGLAVVIQLGEERYLEQFLLEHAPLLEAMVWRARSGAEIACMRTGSFVSMMYEIFEETVQWLEALLSGPQLQSHLWLTLCDIKNSINDCGDSFSLSPATECCWRTCSLNDAELRDSSNNGSSSRSGGGWVVVNPIKRMSSVLSLQNDYHTSYGDGCDNRRRSGLQLINLSNLLLQKSDCERGGNEQGVYGGSSIVGGGKGILSKSSLLAEKFVRDLCELLETVDAKQTNFFISTLITAVLTYHLGWVATVLPPSQDEADSFSQLHNQCNPLWGQLSDLYGAIGHPTKVAHTIVSGTDKGDLIAKILNTLTYFIRCSDLERKCISRPSTDDENNTVDGIFQKAACIPKENLTTYEQLVSSNSNNSSIIAQKSCARLKDSNVVHSDSCSSKMTAMMTTKQQHDEIEMKTFYQKSSFYTKENSDVNLSAVKDSVIVNNACKIGGLTRTHTCMNDLRKIAAKESLYPNLEELNLNNEELKTGNDQIKESGDFAIKLSASEIKEKVGKLCRVPISAVMYHINRSEEIDQAETLANIQEAKETIEKTYSLKKVNMEVQRKEFIPDGTINNEDGVCKGFDKPAKDVIFVLGDNERLVGLKKSCSDFKCENEILWEDELKPERPNRLNLEKNENVCTPKFMCNSSSDESLESPSSEETSSQVDWNVTPKNTEADINVHSQITNMEIECGNSRRTTCKEGEEEVNESALTNKKTEREFSRSHSVPPPETATSQVKKKLKHSGVKFNFQQYPQIVTEYMKSKNLELGNLPFVDKAMKLNRSLSATVFDDCSKFDFSNYECDSEEVETLQTPSNASELEFTNDLVVETREVQHAKEKIEYSTPKTFIRNTLPNTIIREPIGSDSEHPLKLLPHPVERDEEIENLASCAKENRFKVIELPMPKSVTSNAQPSILLPGYTQSLLRGISDKYISDMVLQGISTPSNKWESTVKRDLTLAARHPLLDQPITEAVTIVANTDTWEVQLISSHTYVVDRGTSGVRVGMSQLVSNMLESLLNLWKMHTPAEYCLLHVEAKLKELCLRSQALAKFLIATEFCSMDLLTSSLQLETNDVPLLLAVASTHSPKVTQKYDLSFQ